MNIIQHTWVVPGLQNQSYLVDCASYSEVIDGRAYEHERQGNTARLLHSGTENEESIDALDEGIKLKMERTGKSMNNIFKANGVNIYFTRSFTLLMGAGRLCSTSIS